MPINNTVWGANVANAVQSWASANVPQNDFIPQSKLVELWQIITGQHKEHINDNADIQLIGSEIPIPGAGLFDSVTSAAIAGQATNAAVTLTQKIK